MTRRMVLLAFGLLASPCGAQKTVHSGMVWVAAFGDQHIAEKTAFTWDVQARRAEFGATWQLLLGSLGVTREVSAHWKVAAALGWSHGYRYGAFPARANSFELRPFVQVLGNRTVGGWAWTDRMRTEFRVLRPIGEFAPDGADWMKTVVRLRRQDRFQHPVTRDRQWYVWVGDEVFVNVAPAASRVAMLEQVRLQGVLGHQLSKSNRLEAGYGLQRFNRTGGYEMNHTLIVNFRTSAPLR